MKKSKPLLIVVLGILWTITVAVVSQRIGAFGSWLSVPTQNGDWDPRMVVSSLRDGDEIAIAIDKFKMDNGRFPASLEQLRPKYLRDIKAPRAGVQKWEYETEQGSAYALTLRSRTPGVYYYRNSFSAEWMYQSPDRE